MELSCAFPTGGDVLAHAQLAEELGYRRAWLYDSPALYADVFVTLARIAERTRRLALGIGVLVPGLRHPMAAAAAVASLEQLAPGRLALALGTGFSARYLLGQRPLPWSFVERYARALRGLLAGETVEIDGRLTRMGHPRGFAPPRPIRTPLLIAANGPRGLAVARAHGDGVMAIGAPQSGFGWSALVSPGTVLEPGEDLRSPRVFEALGPPLAMLYHAAWEQGGQALQALPGGRAWGEQIEKLEPALRHLYVHEAHLVELTERDRPHVDPALAAHTFSGAPEQLRARAAQWSAAGVTELVYAPHGPDIPRELRAMARALAGELG
jgi:5,10-methylenetetrahydromethanopterin reductase